MIAISSCGLGKRVEVVERYAVLWRRLGRGCRETLGPGAKEWERVKDDSIGKDTKVTKGTMGKMHRRGGGDVCWCVSVLVRWRL
jgi:hypothetical protein